MNREDDFDLQLARWLEDGPFEAPDRPITAAIEHARTHPRRRLFSALWRSAMDSMHLTPVKPRNTSHAGRSLAVVAGTVAVAVVAVVAGAILLGRPGSEPAPGAVLQPTPVATPAPTPTPASTPTTAPVAVTGTLSCSLTAGTQTTVAGVTQVRGLAADCSGRSLSDARVRGTQRHAVSIDVRADGSADHWGTTTIAGDAGGWAGTFTGIIDKGYTTHRTAALLSGTGAYAGLQFRYFSTSDDEGSTWTVTGTIETVPSFEPTAPVTSPVAVTGTDSCGAGWGGTTTRSGDVTQVRGMGLSCFESLSDARVGDHAGGSTRMYDCDAYADGTGDCWGTGDVWNRGGHWYGVWTGTVNAAQDMSVIGAWIGAGGYAGLEWRATGISPHDANDTTLSGSIQPIR